MAVIAQFIFAILSAFVQGPLPVIMAEMFPAKLRYTGMGLGYNSATAILGGTAPMVATLLIHTTGIISFPAIYLMFFAVVSVSALSVRIC